MRTPQQRRDEIATLPTDELRHRLISRGFGEFTDVAKAELATREHKEASELASRAEDREEESLTVSRKALRISCWANVIAVVAVIIAILAIVFSK